MTCRSAGLVVCDCVMLGVGVVVCCGVQGMSSRLLMADFSRVVGNTHPPIRVVTPALFLSHGTDVPGVPAVAPRGLRHQHNQAVHVGILSSQLTHSPTGNLLLALVKRLVEHVPNATDSRAGPSMGGGSGPAAIHYRVRCSESAPCALHLTFDAPD
jgi:hypothetical protein